MDSIFYLYGGRAATLSPSFTATLWLQGTNRFGGMPPNPLIFGYRMIRVGR